jgi:acetyl-CoA synthetase
MEIESAIVGVEGVAEAAVVSGTDEVRSDSVFAYVSTEDEAPAEERLRDEIVAAVNADIGTIARPEAIIFTPDLPKTRSAKIMRRLLESIANDDDLGDLSALRNPEVVGEIESARDRT